MKTAKSVLSIFLALVMVVLAVPAAKLVGLDLFPQAHAYNVGDHIQFGTYPQSRVDETPALKAAAEAATWRSYNYYTGTGSDKDGKMTSSDYMQFADFFCNDRKYRSVRFTKYRPRNTYETSLRVNSNQYNNGYELNTIYYFEYEPLSWRIIDPSTGFILCENIIDSQAYQNVMYYIDRKYYQNPEGTFYASDYAESSIRKWLAYDFYESSFTETQKANIKTTTLDNQIDGPNNEGYY